VKKHPIHPTTEDQTLLSGEDPVQAPSQEELGHLIMIRDLRRLFPHVPLETREQLVTFVERLVRYLGPDPPQVTFPQKPVSVSTSVTLASDPATKQLILSSASPLIAHTDGGCSGNPGPGGWAVVFSQEGKIVGQHSGHEPATTNNRMELTAIREAIRLAPAQGRLQIVTDSQLAIGWLCQNWKRKEPANAAICAEIDKLRASRASGTNGQGGAVSFDYIKGHNGDPMNELADRLASGATRKAAKPGTMKYDTPIDSYEQAVWCLAEAERRYLGKVVLDEGSNFPLIEDSVGLTHTDAVLRAIGAQFGRKLGGKFPFG
jgi:ribonuclease HI